MARAAGAARLVVGVARLAVGAGRARQEDPHCLGEAEVAVRQQVQEGAGVEVDQPYRGEGAGEVGQQDWVAGVEEGVGVLLAYMQ